MILIQFGDYPLTYVVTDSSGNETKQNFTLHVIEKSTNSEPPAEKEKFPIENILSDYKTEKTKVGIDVSKWQGEIDWQKVKNAGVEFAIIRMGYQTDYDGDCKLDPYFIQNIEGAKNVRITSWCIFLLIFKKCKTSERTSKLGKG
ncbi:MAG: hypothetical protein HFJ24_03035 [Clostridia bacterium]|nr:hypothetical protein [Clostridia bacterium]MCI9274999.1 hypothetical protein [Clostridia bacterium]